MLNSLTGSVLGGIQKAYLIIHKTDAQSISSAQVTAAAQNALLSAASNASAGALSGALNGAGAAATVLQVQYNPTTLSIQANAEAIPFTYLQQNVDNGIPNQNLRPPMVVLSVELIFDAMNPQDAFMLDKARLSVGTMVSNVAGIVQSTKGGYTVQPQTEGLLAALMRANTRLVTFRWADMAFTGQLIEVQADYTMFSVSGKPIRSKVRMNIAQQVESDADCKYWDSALDNMFKSGDEVSLKGAGQKLGNLVNLDAF